MNLRELAAEETSSSDPTLGIIALLIIAGLVIWNWHKTGNKPW